MADFSKELERHIPGLYRYALALSGDSHRAEDLVQDSLERALNKSHLWEEGTNLKAWLFTLMHNLYVNQSKTQYRTPQHLPLDEESAQVYLAPTQASAIDLEKLKGALMQLPEEQRQVLLLVGMEQMAYQETAELLNIPLGTVMSRLSRARERLREQLSQRSKPRLRRIK